MIESTKKGMASSYRIVEFDGEGHDAEPHNLNVGGKNRKITDCCLFYLVPREILHDNRSWQQLRNYLQFRVVTGDKLPSPVERRNDKYCASSQN
jgi:hypothetical protein